MSPKPSTSVTKFINVSICTFFQSIPFPSTSDIDNLKIETVNRQNNNVSAFLV